ncbi:MAG: VacJ family lipoprotein [Rickettsiales bacterium]
MMKKVFYIIFIILASSRLSAATIPATPSYADLYTYDNQDNLSLDSYSEDEGSLVSDPLIILNKHIFCFNSTIDTFFVAPVIETYLAVVPKHGRDCIGNFMNNISEPLNIINSLLKGNFKQAQTSFGRFLTNTVLGFVGIMDVAGDLKMPYKNEDFGETLAHYGVPSGPYIVLPILGPSTLRDSFGKAADFVIDPFNRELNKDSRQVVDITWAVHKRAEGNGIIKMIKKSLNPYDTAKTMYIQNRNSQINNDK